MLSESAPASLVPSKRPLSPPPAPAMPPLPPLLVKRLSAKARLPLRGSAKAAGYDLCRYPTRLNLLPTRLTRECNPAQPTA